MAQETSEPGRIASLIIDGKNLAMRSWYAFRGQLSVEGLGSTSLIHGSLAELFRHVARYRPQRTIITWDQKSAFRRALWSGYKNRMSRLDDHQFSDLNYQMQVFREALDHLAVCQVECEDVEGDDLIALAVVNNTWRPALVVSTDRDFWQLIREGVWIYDPRKKFHLGLTSFSRLTGFDSPGHYLAFKCLRGDPGDGVPPAVNRMGEAKAKKLSRDLKLPGQLRESAHLTSIAFNGDEQTERNIARNFKLVSLHAALFIQLPALARVRFDFPKPDYDGFMGFCAKYKLSVVAKAYGEVCQYL